MQNNATLVILAAGLGSRYKGGLKQLAPIGPNGECIMDYSINDAKDAGFNKVVFIIRKEIEEEFKNTIGKRVESIIDVKYAYQEFDNTPIKTDIKREKPWGTVHSLLCAREFINEPFCVINADDYYGKESFKNVYNYLMTNNNKQEYVMSGYILKNTMSENGGVNRGICQIDNNGYLVDVKETKKIRHNGLNALGEFEGNEVNIPLDNYVSMNFWGFYPNLFEMLETEFIDFLNNLNEEKETSECLLPTVIDKLIKEGKIKVKVLETNDKWFGITYQEDNDKAKDTIKTLIKTGKYKENMYR